MSEMEKPDNNNNISFSISLKKFKKNPDEIFNNNQAQKPGNIYNKYNNKIKSNIYCIPPRLNFSLASSPGPALYSARLPKNEKSFTFPKMSKMPKIPESHVTFVNDSPGPATYNYKINLFQNFKKLKNFRNFKKDRKPSAKNKNKNKTRNIICCPQSFREFRKTEHAKLVQPLNDEKLYFLNGKKLIEQSRLPGPGSYFNSTPETNLNSSFLKVSGISKYNSSTIQNSPLKSKLKSKLNCSRNARINQSLDNYKIIEKIKSELSEIKNSRNVESPTKQNALERSVMSERSERSEKSEKEILNYHIDTDQRINSNKIFSSLLFPNDYLKSSNLYNKELLQKLGSQIMGKVNHDSHSLMLKSLKLNDIKNIKASKSNVKRLYPIKEIANTPGPQEYNINFNINSNHKLKKGIPFAREQLKFTETYKSGTHKYIPFFNINNEEEKIYNKVNNRIFSRTFLKPISSPKRIKYIKQKLVDDDFPE